MHHYTGKRGNIGFIYCSVSKESKMPQGRQFVIIY